MGRTGGHQQSREIDLDLIAYGAETGVFGPLILPHPRFHSRAYVLIPLREIAPGFVCPRTGTPVAALVAARSGGVPRRRSAFSGERWADMDAIYAEIRRPHPRAWVHPHRHRRQHRRRQDVAGAPDRAATGWAPGRGPRRRQSLPRAFLRGRGRLRVPDPARLPDEPLQAAARAGARTIYSRTWSCSTTCSRATASLRT